MEAEKLLCILQCTGQPPVTKNESTQNIKSPETEKPCFSVSNGNATQIDLCKVMPLLGGHRYISYDYHQDIWDHKILLPCLLSLCQFHVHRSASCTLWEMWLLLATEPLSLDIRGWLSLFPWFHIRNAQGRFLLAQHRSGAHYWAGQLWSGCRAGSCDTNMAPDSPLRYTEASPKGKGIILSQAATPVDNVCFHCMSPDCQDICKSDIVSSRAVSKNVT